MYGQICNRFSVATEKRKPPDYRQIKPQRPQFAELPALDAARGSVKLSPSNQDGPTGAAGHSVLSR
jgi:hypothetical protein